MHARQLVELAALVVNHGPALVIGQGRISPSAIAQYWAATKCRFERWNAAFQDIGRGGRRDDRRTAEALKRLRPVLEEILTGEILTRVWTGALVAYDRRRGIAEAEPVARSVLAGHLEAREQALSLIVHGREIETPHAVALNRLRRRCERWSDLLLGFIVATHDASEFGVEIERVRDFAEDLQYHSRQPGGENIWPLTLASLRGAFRQGLSLASANPAINTNIAASILACFPADAFDATGAFRSLWLVRLTNGATDAQGLVDELLEVPRPRAANPVAQCRILPSATDDRRRRFGG